MQMRIVVADAGSAASLAERLTAAIGAERISLWGARREIDVRIERESDRAILRVLDAVVRWLDYVGTGFAELWIGKRTYTLASGITVETWRPPVAAEAKEDSGRRLARH
jgi:hypothetical protein